MGWMPCSHAERRCKRATELNDSMWHDVVVCNVSIFFSSLDLPRCGTLDQSPRGTKTGKSGVFFAASSVEGVER